MNVITCWADELMCTNRFVKIALCYDGYLPESVYVEVAVEVCHDLLMEPGLSNQAHVLLLHLRRKPYLYIITGKAYLMLHLLTQTLAFSSAFKKTCI